MASEIPMNLEKMDLEPKKHVYVELEWDQGTMHPLSFEDEDRSVVRSTISELRDKKLLNRTNHRYAVLYDGNELALTEPLTSIPQGATLQVVEKDNRIIPPYPWATDRIFRIHSLETLNSKNLKKIAGDVRCRRCEADYVYEFDLEEKFREVSEYIKENRDDMQQRAPRKWLSPEFPTACTRCGEFYTMKPMIPQNKNEINWLFLLLGQMLGSCTLEQLKYFCRETEIPHFGGKDLVLFRTFLGLCKQLDPLGTFNL